MKRQLLVAALAAMFATSCTDTELRMVRGTLYADSTLTTPLAGETLQFTLDGSGQFDSVATDSRGRFGYAFNVGIDPIVRQASKTSIEYTWIFILHNGDTLYGTEYPYIDGDTLVLYPGCYEERRAWL